MRMGFEQPGFFISTAALLVLLALYLWYRRSRRKDVPALFLWDKPETSPQSGSRFELKRLPLSFYLESLAVLLLAAAAAAPYWMLGESYPPLAVVLDNSYSMQAAMPGEPSPRQAAEKYLSDYLKRTPKRRLICIAAGPAPRLVADSYEEVDMAAFGRSDEPGSDLFAAIALARSISAHAEILVLTDHAPSFPLTDDISWFSGGGPKPNVALVNARRQDDKILLEAVNYAAMPQRARAVLSPGGQGEWFTLAPGERRKVVVRLPVSAEKLPVEVLLETPADSLPFDNRAYLQPDLRPPVVYRFSTTLPEPARKSLEDVLRDNPLFTQNGEPELLFDTPGKSPGKYHRLIWHGAGNSAAVMTAELISAFSGQELTRGLPLQDLRWTALPAQELPGRPLLQRGAALLLSESRRLDGRIDVHLNLDPLRSNLSQRPFWPIFFWNLADELHRERPGPERVNYRAGETVSIRLPDPAPLSLTLTLPDGTQRKLEPVNRSAYFVTGAPGIYHIDNRWDIAVSTLDPAESDLRSAEPYTRQSQMLPDATLFPRRPLAFICLLLALAVLVFHQYKLGNARRGV